MSATNIMARSRSVDDSSSLKSFIEFAGVGQLNRNIIMP